LVVLVTTITFNQVHSKSYLLNWHCLETWVLPKSIVLNTHMTGLENKYDKAHFYI